MSGISTNRSLWQGGLNVNQPAAERILNSTYESITHGRVDLAGDPLDFHLKNLTQNSTDYWRKNERD